MGSRKPLMARGTGLLLAGFLLGCSAGPRPFSVAPPVWTDDDRRPFRPRPEPSFVPLYWDGADQILFRPLARAFLLEEARDAVNVNALDEVPDSSWFTNRIGRRPMSAEEVARGACTHPSPEEDRPWKVAGAKLDGDNPGFQIITAAGINYLLKFDTPDQWERASSGDVVGSRLYHAAGFTVPCNRVVYFRSEELELPATEVKGPEGKPLTRKRIEEMLSKSPREKDGTVRAMASQFLPGKLLGPWYYSDRRGGDPNDVIEHQDRRELRGSRLLGAWINHHDARAQNTMAMWIEDGGGKGHVEHGLLDWGDTLGGLWWSDSFSRRVGYTYYIDFGAMGADFITFGAVTRPWEDATYGPAGQIFGYFDDAKFEPEDWHVGNPNPAFSALQEADGAWMARIISRFDDAAVSAVVKEARLSSPIARSELERILKGRRDRILRRYLLRLSSLGQPTVEGQLLCLEDRAESVGLGAAPVPSARLWFSTTGAELQVVRRGPGQLCIALPDLGAQQRVVDVSTGRRGQLPLRVYVLGGEAPRVVGLERPEGDLQPPG